MNTPLVGSTSQTPSQPAQNPTVSKAQTLALKILVACTITGAVLSIASPIFLGAPAGVAFLATPLVYIAGVTIWEISKNADRELMNLSLSEWIDQGHLSSIFKRKLFPQEVINTKYEEMAQEHRVLLDYYDILSQTAKTYGYEIPKLPLQEMRKTSTDLCFQDIQDLYGLENIFSFELLTPQLFYEKYSQHLKSLLSDDNNIEEIINSLTETNFFATQEYSLLNLAQWLGEDDTNKILIETIIFLQDTETGQQNHNRIPLTRTNSIKQIAKKNPILDKTENTHTLCDKLNAINLLRDRTVLSENESDVARSEVISNNLSWFFKYLDKISTVAQDDGKHPISREDIESYCKGLSFEEILELVWLRNIFTLNLLDQKTFLEKYERYLKKLSKEGRYQSLLELQIEVWFLVPFDYPLPELQQLISGANSETDPKIKNLIEIEESLREIKNPEKKLKEIREKLRTQ